MSHESNVFGDSEGSESAASRDEDGGESSGSERDQSPPPDPHFQAQVLLISLLEQTCKMYSPDTELCERLFNKMCSMLVNRGMIPAEFVRDSYGVFRQQWQESVRRMMDTAAREIQRTQSMATPSSALVRLGDVSSLPRSMSSPAPPPTRYQSEFIQIKRLGSGAFGSVYKAQHKLDKQYFAVKKLICKKLTPDVWTEIRREVEVLASLRHQHVVGYNSSWVEYQPNLHDSRAGWEDRVDVDEVDELVNTDDDAVEVIFDEKADSQIRLKDNEQCLICLKRCQNDVNDTSTASDVIYCQCIVRRRRRHRTSSNPEVEFDDVIKNRKVRPQFMKMLSHDAENLNKQIAIRKDVNNSLLQGRITVCIQMQLCDKNLRQWLEERNDKASLNGDVFACVDSRENSRIFHQILLAVDYIHSQRVIHRDLKPRNIFLHGPTNDVRIGDFGLARSLIDVEKDDSEYATTNLSPGVGTAFYAAPEQEGHDYCEKCDMYSLGILLYELYHPFVTESERIQVLMNFTKFHIVATEVLKAWPKEVKCIRGLTNRNPNNRPGAGNLLQTEIFRAPDSEKIRLKREVRLKDSKIRRLQKNLKKMKLKNESDPSGSGNCDGSQEGYLF